jgi:large repetitive protein
VRATDPSANTDQTPAGYSFEVALAPTALPAQPPPAPSPPAVPPPGKTKSVAPETTLTKPAARTHDRTPTFRFTASKPGASFQCKLDGGPFRVCSSPFTTKKLGFGSHTLQVRALTQGATDPTPAKLNFKVAKG